MYTVYKIEYNNRTIYYGQTKNIEARTKQHKYSIKSKKNKLYQFARDNSITEFKLIAIRSFKKRTDAKRYECYLVLGYYFNNKPLLNKIPNISDR